MLLVASGSPQDGRGHVARALALADAFVFAGARPELALLRGALGPVEAARAAAIGLTLTDPVPPGAGGVVVLDVPDVNAEAHRFDAARLAVFDDRDALVTPAAIVIQPSQPSWTGRRRTGPVLSGYRFAPVGPAYRRLRPADGPVAPARRRRRGPVHVVACFGGSDPANVTGRLVGALSPGRGWDCEVVVGLGFAAETDAWSIPVARDPDDLPERLAAADLVLIGAGTMKFEVASLGVPALLLAVADDQRLVGPPFAATGAARYLGDGRRLPPADVRAAIEAVALDDPGRATMAETAWRTVDGDGATRIAAAILDSLVGASPDRSGEDERNAGIGTRRSASDEA